jgi:hypothetical protein
MDKYKYLILAEWDEAPFLVLAESTPPEEGFVSFLDGNELRIGEIVKSCFISEDSDEYSMFSMLYPIFDAAKMYNCCYDKEDSDG